MGPGSNPPGVGVWARLNRKTFYLGYKHSIIHSEIGIRSGALQKSENLFYVIDAAQVAVELHPEAFYSAHKEPRPVLTDLVRVIRESCNVGATAVHKVDIVVCGTEDCSQVLEEIDPLPSAQPNCDAWKRVSGLGGFDDPAENAAYLVGYLWPELQSEDNLAGDQHSFIKRSLKALGGW